MEKPCQNSSVPVMTTCHCTAKAICFYGCHETDFVKKGGHFKIAYIDKEEGQMSSLFY